MTPSRAKTILIADDEPNIVWALQQFLEGEGYAVDTASSAENALEQYNRRRPDLVLLDVRLPGMDGLTALTEFRRRAPDLPVVMMTAHGNMETAVEAIKRGAFEYLTKPVRLDEVRAALGRAFERQRLSEEVQRLRAQLANAPRGGLIGASGPMQEVFKKIGALAASDATVLITGESGTGKEFAARALHASGRRAEGPFVALNCAAMPETLLESELYGHMAGAFTGAIKDKPGRAELAEGGTLLLDEVTEMPISSQAKLLRFLEERRFERLGSTKTQEVDTRIVATTNRDLDALRAEGKIREDLYYRLNVVSIRMPPLRERMEDVPLLAAHFLGVYGADPEAGMSEEALEALTGYAWPGNVRELRNAIEHAVVMARGRSIRPEHLPPATVRGAETAGLAGQSAEGIKKPKASLDAELTEYARQAVAAARAKGGEGNLYEEMVRRCEKPLLAAALAAMNGNQVRAAQMLGIHRTTLRKKIEEYGLGTARDEAEPADGNQQ
jgi:DNA-binding NtrC family response regulator